MAIPPHLERPVTAYGKTEIFSPQKQAYPPNSEEFYRSTESVEAIKARIAANVTERDTYLNAVNHEMDEIRARTTAHGGVLSDQDRVRLATLKQQVREVMAGYTDPADKDFHDKLWFAAERTRTMNPANLDYADMQGAEIAPLMKGSSTHQLEYLSDLDAENAQLTIKQSLGTFTAADQQRAAQIQAQIETVIRSNPEEVRFNESLDGRLKRFAAIASGERTPKHPAPTTP